MKVLVLNCGSSSLKFQLIETDPERVKTEGEEMLAEGVVEKIRAEGGEIYAITSEPQYLADQAHEHWGLNFNNVAIRNTCRDLSRYSQKTYQEHRS